MKHKKILLVDDDEDDQLIFSDAINVIAPEIECLTANNGVEAITLLKTMDHLPSIIFLDLNMPLMNGFECLQQIINEPAFNQIPVVIFSTSDNPKDNKNTIAAGAKKFLTKTPDYHLLKTKLLEILEADFL